MKFTTWDIVLTNLQPGAHTINGRVWADGEEYGWEVNLLIEERFSDGNLSRNDRKS